MYVIRTTVKKCVLVLFALALLNAYGVSETYKASAIVDATTDANNFEQIVLEKLQQEAYEKHQQHSNDILSVGTASTEVLSRKRRYLIFPEGSSFQFVYDVLVGVVDYSNYLILGITVALAWELPSETPSDVLQSLQDRLKDGTLGTTRRNDTVSKITYVDTKRAQNPKPQYINFWQPSSTKKKTYNYYYTNRRLQSAFQIPMHRQYQSYYYRQPTQGQNSASWKRKNWTGNQPHTNYAQNAYYSPKKHPFWKWTRPHTSHGYTPNPHSAAVKYPWWNLPSRLSNPKTLRRPLIAPVHISANGPARRLDIANSQQKGKHQHQQQQQQQRQRNRAGYGQSSAATTRKHRIYPIFGKRSIKRTPADGDDDNDNDGNGHKRAKRNDIDGPELSQLDRIHIRYQRSSRQTLFAKIEKFLDRRDFNGHHCVLRALCETNKKRYDDKRPGSFVGELMRAVFTVPEPLEEDIQTRRVPDIQQRYDSAGAFEGDCTTQYQHCTDSLWESDFIA